MTYCQNNFVIAVKSSDTHVDVIDSKTMLLKQKLDVDQAKCIWSMERYVFVGTWASRIMVYDSKADLGLLKILKTKA
jgi:hypothetical protein